MHWKSDDDALPKFISLSLMDEETVKNDADYDGKEAANFNNISAG